MVTAYPIIFVQHRNVLSVLIQVLEIKTTLRDKLLDICEEGWKSGFSAKRFSWITYTEILFFPQAGH